MFVTRHIEEMYLFLRSGHVGCMKVLLKMCGVNSTCTCVYVGDLLTVLLKAKVIVTVRPVFGWGTARDVPRSSGNRPSSRSNDVHGTVYIIQQ